MHVCKWLGSGSCTFTHERNKNKRTGEKSSVEKS